MGKIIEIVDEIRAKYPTEEKGLTIAQKTERNDKFVEELLARVPRLHKDLTIRLKTSKPASVMFQAYVTLRVFNILPTKFNDLLMAEWRKADKNADAFKSSMIALSSFPAVHEAVNMIDIGKTFKPDDWKKDFFALINWEDILEEEEPAQEEAKQEAAPVAQEDAQIPLSDSRKQPEAQPEPQSAPVERLVFPSHYQAVIAPKAVEEAPKAPAKKEDKKDEAPAVEVKAKGTIKKAEKTVKDIVSALELSNSKEAGEAILDLIIYTADKKKAVAEDALEFLTNLMKSYQKNNYSLYTALVSFLNAYTHIKCEEVESKLKKKTHTISVKSKALTKAFSSFYARGILPKQDGIYFTPTGEQTSGDLFLTLDYFMSKAKEEKALPSADEKALKEAQRYVAPIVKAEAPAKVVEALKALSDDEYKKAKEHLEALQAAFEKVEAERQAKA